MAVVEAITVKELDQAEGIKLVDDAARRRLGISGEEFKRRWEAGEYADNPDRPEVMWVAMLLPFAD